MADHEAAVNKAVDAIITEVAGLLSDLVHARQHGWFERYPADEYTRNFEQVHQKAEDVVRALETYEVHMRQLKHEYFQHAGTLRQF